MSLSAARGVEFWRGGVLVGRKLTRSHVCMWAACPGLCCVFSNVFFHLVALARSCPAAKWSSLCFPWATTGQYTCENLPKWIIYMISSTKSEGGTCLHLTARVSLKPQPGSAGTLLSKASDKSLPLSYVLVYVGWALIYEKRCVCNVYCASTPLQFHTKTWQLEPCRLHRAQGWKHSGY